MEKRSRTSGERSRPGFDDLEILSEGKKRCGLAIKIYDSSPNL